MLRFAHFSTSISSARFTYLSKISSSLNVVIVGADNFAVEVVPPVDPEVFHPCHQHLIMENGIYLHEGMTFEGLIERQVYEFAYIFAPLPIVGATGSPGNPIAVL